MKTLAILGNGPTLYSAWTGITNESDYEKWAINRAYLMAPGAMIWLWHPFDLVFDGIQPQVLAMKPAIMSPEPVQIDGIRNEVYPLQEVMDFYNLSYPYFANTACYALAYAGYLFHRRIAIFGLDHTRREEDEEKACVAYWLGRLAGIGTEIIRPEGCGMLKKIIYHHEEKEQ